MHEHIPTQTYTRMHLDYIYTHDETYGFIYTFTRTHSFACAKTDMHPYNNTYIHKTYARFLLLTFMSRCIFSFSFTRQTFENWKCFIEDESINLTLYQLLVSYLLQRNIRTTRVNVTVFPESDLTSSSWGFQSITIIIHFLIKVKHNHDVAAISPSSWSRAQVSQQ